MDKWKPNNFLGLWSYDPRDEIRFRAQVAMKQHDTYVAIPIVLAMALAELHECDSTTTLFGDKEGPLPPMLTRCKKLKGHTDEWHFNGAISWK